MVEEGLKRGLTPQFGEERGKPSVWRGCAKLTHPWGEGALPLHSPMCMYAVDVRGGGCSRKHSTNFVSLNVYVPSFLKETILDSVKHIQTCSQALHAAVLRDYSLLTCLLGT